MIQSPAVRPSKFRHVPWLAVLVVVLAFVALDAWRSARHIDEVSGSYGVTVDPPSVDANSPTGYAHGVRSLVLPGRAMDGYHWIMQAQLAMARGEWRVRHVDYDGGPRGRDVHWAMPFRLYLIFLAWLDHTVGGDPWGIAIERAAVWSGPILLIVALAALTPWLARRFSPAAAMLTAAGAVTAYPFYVDFVAGYADHHGLVNLCALLCVLLLIDHRGEVARARRDVRWSGVAGGVGLWISAATQVPVLIGIGAGALWVLWCERRSNEPSIWSAHPELFRRWGIAGGATSLLAYLLEYAPSDFSLRLEVNHPLYALAWIGAGEALCRLARVLRAKNTARRADVVAGAAALAAVAVLPAMILAAPTSFAVAEPFLWRLHHDFIAEFETLTDFLRQGGYAWRSLACILPLVAIGPAAWLALRQKFSPETRAMLVLAAAPAALATAMAWNQVRWWGLACALLAPLVAAMFRVIEREENTKPRGRAKWALAGALLLLPGAIAAGGRLARSGEMAPDDLQSLAERDVAQWLRQRAGDKPVVVAGSPTVTTALIFFGGLHGIGTLYWENNDGLHTAARLYAARDDAAARAIVEQNHITHLVVVTWDGFEGIYTRLIRKLPAEASIPPDAFIARLLPAAIPPPWLRVVPFKLPANPAFEGAQIRIYEVTPGQSPAEAAAHAADAALDRGDTEAAAKLLPELGKFRDDLRPLVARARILFQRSDSVEFAHAVEEIVARLPQARALPLEDHVHLVTVLAMASRFEPAGEELGATLKKMNEAALRQLPAGTLVELLSLSEVSGQRWPDERLHEFARELVPPALRR